MPPCPAPDIAWLYLIRHGATASNLAVPPRLQGQRIDQPLCAEGHQQAQRAAEFLAALPLDVVYSSPLLRARQTAETIARPHRLAVQTVDALIEVDVGHWEGRTWTEIEQTDPEACRAFAANPETNPYLGGENLSDVLRRVAPAFERLMSQNVGRIGVAVAHSVVNRVYLAHVLGLPLARYRAIAQDNCAINLLSYRAGLIKAVTINASSHGKHFCES